MKHVAAAREYTLGVKQDGTVWVWGKQSNPAPVSGLTGVEAVAAGAAHSLAVKTDGTVWAWGWNAHGQLGDGTTIDRYNPVQVPGLTNVVAVSAGERFSLALKSDGSVWAWGGNADGQLGDGTNTQRLTPVQVPGLTGVVAVASGVYHAVALKSDGTVWAWGNNGYYQMGDGTTTQRLSPVQVSGLTGVTAIAAGSYHSLALMSGGSVWAWGSNSSGSLGNGTTTTQKTPVQVAGLTGVTAIAAGGSHSLTVTSDGGVWTWGGNGYGQLGDGTLGSRSIPAQVPTLTGASKIAAGVDHSIVVRSDGTTWGWGDNTYHQLGFTPAMNVRTPTRPVGLSDEFNWLQQVIGGERYSLALKADGTVWAWGNNQYGQLGDGSTIQRNTPVQVPGLTNVAGVAAGQFHSVAVKSDGTVWAWGRNSIGQLGDGTNTERRTPSQVPGLTGVVAVVSGSHYSLALKADGTVWGWGWNVSGELGDGTTTSRKTPVQVSGLTGVVRLAKGRALKSDGTVWAWGYNTDGRLGDGTTVHRYTPVQVAGLTDVMDIAGGAHSLAIKSDGTVWGWGPNTHGQVGDGTTTKRVTPVQVAGLTDVVAVTTGLYHSLAAKADGTVWAWGYNTDGQLGDGTTTTRITPVQVPGMNVNPPGGSVVIREKPYTNSATVSLTLRGPTIGAGVNEMRFSDDGTVWSAWEPYAATKSYALPAGRGFKRVYVQFRDAVGTVFDGVSDSTTLNTGSGTMVLSLVTALAGQTGLTLPFTYTADSHGMNLGAVAVTVPAGWSAPSVTPTDAGYTTANIGTVTVSGQTITVSGVTLAAGQSFSITYGDRSAGGPGAVATTTPGVANFAVQQKSTAGDMLLPLESSPSVTVSSPTVQVTVPKGQAIVAGGTFSLQLTSAAALQWSGPEWRKAGGGEWASLGGGGSLTPNMPFTITATAPKTNLPFQVRVKLIASDGSVRYTQPVMLGAPYIEATRRTDGSLAVPSIAFNPGNWTVDLMFRPDNRATTEQSLWSLIVDDRNSYSVKLTPDGKVHLVIWSDGIKTDTLLPADPVLPLGQSARITVRGDGNKVAVFVNRVKLQAGDLEYTEPVGGLPAQMSFGGTASMGLVDRVRLFGHALTDEEIAAFPASGQSWSGDPTQSTVEVIPGL